MCLSVTQYDPDKRFRQAHIVQIKCLVKKWSDLFIRKSGYSTPYTGNIECILIPFTSKVYKSVDIGLYSIYATLHCRNSIGLPLNTLALPHYRAKLHQSGACGSSCMISGKVTPEHKYIILAERSDIIRGKFQILYIHCTDIKKAASI